MPRKSRSLDPKSPKISERRAQADGGEPRPCSARAARFWLALPLWCLCQCGEPANDQSAAARTHFEESEALARRELEELIAALIPLPPEGETPKALPLLLPEKTDDPQRDLKQFETALRRADAQILGLYIAMYQQSANLLKQSEIRKRSAPPDVPGQLDRELPELRPRFNALLAHREALLAGIAELRLKAQPPTSR